MRRARRSTFRGLAVVLGLFALTSLALTSLGGRVWSAEPSPTLSLAQILDALEATCNDIDAFDAYVTDESSLLLQRTVTGLSVDIANPPPAGDWQVLTEPEVVRLVTRQAYSRGRCRIEGLELYGVALDRNMQVMVWDGMLAKRSELAAARGVIDAHFDTFPNPYGICLVNLYRSFDGEYTYVDELRKRSPESIELTRIGDELRIEAHAERDPAILSASSGWRMVFWLDPSRGCMPRQIELFVNEGDTVPQTRIVNELEEVATAVWFPTRSRVSVLVVEAGSKFLGRELAVHEVTLDRERSRFNETLGDEEFELEFPPGTRVIDRVRNMTYQIGRETPQAFLDHLALKGRLSMEDLQAQRPRLQRITRTASLSWNGRQLLLLSANLAVAGVLIVLWLRRARGA